MEKISVFVLQGRILRYVAVLLFAMFLSCDKSSLTEDPDTPGGEPGIPDVPVLGNVPHWMELPAVADTGRTRFVTHDMVVGEVPARNYSLFWDDTHLLAHWVAYHLSSWSIGDEDSGRTEAWQYDPEIPRECQPRLERGFPSSGSPGYDRGHQIPSADRQNVESNRQTYYFSNMTPQLSGFNQGIWADLEIKVRDIAYSTDTLYVVTGCIVKGSEEKAFDNDKKEITVPTAYFKALMKYSKSEPGTGVRGYSAAGYYLKHKDYSQESVDESMLMSIDELEKKTGIDFFVNLVDELGEEDASRVESTVFSANLWL